MANITLYSRFSDTNGLYCTASMICPSCFHNVGIKGWFLANLFFKLVTCKYITCWPWSLFLNWKRIAQPSVGCCHFGKRMQTRKHHFNGLWVTFEMQKVLVAWKVWCKNGIKFKLFSATSDYSNSLRFCSRFSPIYCTTL
jgi:hypothetical protein